MAGFLVYSHWLSPGLRQGPGLGHGFMGYMFFSAEPFTLCLNRERDLHRDSKNGLHTHFSGPETVSGGVFLMTFQCISGV